MWARRQIFRSSIHGACNRVLFTVVRTMSLHHEVRFSLKVLWLGLLQDSASAVYNIIRLEYSLECLSPCYFLWLLKLAGLPVSPAYSNSMVRPMFSSISIFCDNPVIPAVMTQHLVVTASEMLQHMVALHRNGTDAASQRQSLPHCSGHACLEQCAYLTDSHSATGARR